ncbi:MAG: RimK family alpha-L-glutamate ligase [Planctomycetota bacterium]
MVSKPFAIYHEHPHWFLPLFAELDRRSIPYVRLDPRAHWYDPSEADPPYSLVFNRMSPSAYLRDGIQGTFYTLGWLSHLERLGVPIVNGLRAFAIETSKARQLSLLQQLQLGYPASRVLNHASRVDEAVAGLRFPVVFKANIGGSGAGIVRFDTSEGLRRGAASGSLDFGVDHTALLQEYVPARNNHIVRVELLGGKFLYAIKVFVTGETFNLCPADICQRSDGVELQRSACPVDAPKTGLRVEGYQPPSVVVDACERIMQTANIDVGGIEYMVDDRDGRILYYDINALSNFVADATNVVGFDPFVKLVDYLEQRAR